MTNKDVTIKYINESSKKNIAELRKIYKKTKNFDDFLYKELKKIFLILCPPYYAFEILANCVDDIKDNKKYYPGMKSEEIEKINSISKKLDNICICLNSAAYELDKLLSNFDKYSSFEYNN